MLEVQLLGGFSIKAGQKSLVLSSRAAQSLFAYLVLNAGTSFRREKLAGMLWPDSTEAAARDYLRHALWRVRKVLEGASAVSLLEVDDLTIGIHPTMDFRFDCRLVQEAAKGESADDLMEALSAFGGELLPGFYEDWVVLEREHLQATYEKEMDRLLSLLQQEGRWNDVLVWAEKWIAFGQKPEAAYRALMSAHAANGDMSRLAAVYERCVKTLRDVNMQPSEQTRVLYEELKSGKSSSAAAATAAPIGPPTSNIPVPLTSFVGRARELKEIAKALESSRLITLTGTGGVGKTRLAIQAAGNAMRKFRDGVAWVALTGLTDSNLVPQAIAQVLRVPETASEPLLQTLAAHLKPREMLLVFDNCEHLIKAVAQAAEQLLGECPHLKILATSVEGVGLFSERVWQVPSLPLPEEHKSFTLPELDSFESIRLFHERAASQNPGFGLNEQNAAFIVQICQRLDGIPLAIELAAARTRVLSVDEIAARLDDRFSLLTSGSRTAIPRHQTLRATIDWSHELLSEPERVLFRRLAVFAGGFTLQAAESVCADGLPEGGVLDLLGRLVDKSLVLVETSEHAGTTRETRYRQLETIRHYALEKLVASGDAPRARQEHLDFYLRLAEESELHIYGIDSGQRFWRLYRDLDNLRSATEWGTTSGGADLALRILGAIVYFWFGRGLPGSEWNERVQNALAQPEGMRRSLARAKALNGIGFMYWADIYPLDRRSDFEEALSIGEELHDLDTIGTAFRNLGLHEMLQGNYAEARRELDRSLETWDALGESGHLGKAIALTFLGDAFMTEGAEGEASRFYEQAVGSLSAPGDVNFLAYATRRLGQLAWGAGDYAAGTELNRRSMKLNQEVSDPRGISACLAGFAAIAVRKGDYDAAATLAGAVETQLAAFGIRLLLVDRLEFSRTVGILHEKLPKARLEKMWARGGGFTLEGAVAFAMEAR